MSTLQEADYENGAGQRLRVHVAMQLSLPGQAAQRAGPAMKPIIWSYGGGTQSIAIAILIAQGKLPTPDRIVFADTGGEMTEVWDYLHNYVEPLLLNAIGKKIEIAPHALAKVDFYAKNGDLLIPAYTETGKLPTFCSKEWKTLVVRRYLGGAKAFPDGLIMWLGMSADEIERLKPSDKQWIEHHWPLCDLPVRAGYGIQMNRVECRQLVHNFGWPDPPKSACVWCPHLLNPERRRMKAYAPQDHARAVAVGRQLRLADKKGGVWLHESRHDLDEADLSRDNPSSLFEEAGCESGYCWT